MSIESNLERIANALELIALRTGQAVGAAPAAQTVSSPPPAAPAAVRVEESDVAHWAKGAPPEKPAATPVAVKSAKPAKPVKPAPAPVTEPAETGEDAANDSSFLDEEESETQPAQPALTVDDIRSAAVALQKKLGSEEQVRKILVKQGATPLTKSLKNATQEKLREVLNALQPAA